jgi:glycosyltransferase involved in cell wall biosynthesis
MSARVISVAIPHYNNARFMRETLSPLITDDRINEIVICDDASKDIQELEEVIKDLNCSKIKLFNNQSNLGCYYNKLESVSKCSNDWAILLDSDNVIEKDYIDKLYTIENWQQNIIYAPVHAITFPGPISTSLNYERFSDMIINKDVYVDEFNTINFMCLMNNCNYFLPVKEYTSCMNNPNLNYDRHQIDSQDSSVLFTEWICNNNFVKVVSGLKYKHRTHQLSNYVTSTGKQYEAFVLNCLFNKVKTL